jgi:hypothetical protein
MVGKSIALECWAASYAITGTLHVFRNRVVINERDPEASGADCFDAGVALFSQLTIACDLRPSGLNVVDEMGNELDSGCVQVCVCVRYHWQI